MVPVSEGVLGSVALTMVQGDCIGADAGTPAAAEATAAEAVFDELLGPLAPLSHMLRARSIEARASG